MPVIEVTTNLVRSKIPNDFMKLTIELISNLLGKPKNRVVLVIRPDALISHGGDEDLSAVIHLSSIGKIDKESNNKTSAALCPHFEKHLGIKGEKITILFQDMKGENIGRNGHTLA